MKCSCGVVAYYYTPKNNFPCLVCAQIIEACAVDKQDV